MSPQKSTAQIFILISVIERWTLTINIHVDIKISVSFKGKV